MEFYEAVRTRRTIRKFKRDVIPREQILRILEAANLAPTAQNRQPWSFMVVDRPSIERMSAIMDQAFKIRFEEFNSAAVRERLKDLPIPVDESNDKVKGLNEFYRSLGDAPIAIVVYVDREGDPWQWKNNICDASAAIENLLLAAWCEGIGACWMTGPLKKKEAEIKEFLGIQGDKEIVGILPMGIPVYIPKGPPKQDVRSKVRWFDHKA